jgi:hypothetical protein
VDIENFAIIDSMVRYVSSLFKVVVIIESICSFDILDTLTDDTYLSINWLNETPCCLLSVGSINFRLLFVEYFNFSNSKVNSKSEFR